METRFKVGDRIVIRQIPKEMETPKPFVEVTRDFDGKVGQIADVSYCGWASGHSVLLAHYYKICVDGEKFNITVEYADNYFQPLDGTEKKEHHITFNFG